MSDRIDIGHGVTIHFTEWVVAATITVGSEINVADRSAGMLPIVERRPGSVE
jgi:hypothetical protein